MNITDKNYSKTINQIICLHFLNFQYHKVKNVSVPITKIVSFNCSYENLNAATELIGSYFHENGHKVDFSSTMGSMTSECTFEGGVSTLIEILNHRGIDSQSRFEVTVTVDHSGLETPFTDGFNKINTDEIIQIVISVTRNILEKRVKSNADLEELKFENLKKRGKYSKMNEHVLWYTVAIVALCFLCYYLIK